MKKFAMLGAVFIMPVPGIMYLFAPQVMLDTPQIQLKTINELHAFRAAYGGGVIGIAALFSLGAFDRPMERDSLWAIVQID